MNDSIRPIAGPGQSWSQEELWQLLRRQARLYTAGESGSLPVETAEELLSSIRFCLEIAAHGPTAPGAAADPSAAFEAGQRALAGMAAKGRALWQEVCARLPPVENRSMADTLKSIGLFWGRYNIRFFAHQIPCDIDYQLSIPVPEQLMGVLYVNEYLERLAVENAFLLRFSRDAMVSVLNRYCRDHRELVVNLWEPVAVNALGRVLLGLDPRGLVLTPEDGARLDRLFSEQSRQGIHALLLRAAEMLAVSPDPPDPRLQRLLTGAGERLVPRIVAARDHGGLSGIFLSAPA